MKKTMLFPIALCVLLQFPAKSQDNPSRWSIGFTAGPAIPVGEFAGIHNPNAAEAKVSTGSTAELSGAFRVWRTLNALFAVSGQLNHGNGIPYYLGPITFYRGGETRHPEGFDADWQIARILAGGSYTVARATGRGPALMVRLLAGIQRTRTPHFVYLDDPIEPPVGYTNWVNGKAYTLPWAFSYEADAGIRWGFPGRIALLAYAGYNGCRPSQYAMEPFASRNIPTGEKPSFPTGTIHLRMGLELRL